MTAWIPHEKLGCSRHTDFFAPCSNDTTFYLGHEQVSFRFNSPSSPIVRPSRLDRVVGVERAALERQLRLELGREGEQRVVLQRGQPVLGQTLLKN